MELFTAPLQLVFFGTLALTLVFVYIRLFRGPSMLDAVVCVDALVVIVVSLMAGLAMVVGTSHFFDAIIALSVVAFVGTVLLAKYLETGGVIDRDE
jgi:multicomponent Na+:H+ antiporter subunit F